MREICPGSLFTLPIRSSWLLNARCMAAPIETREWWPLPTVETEANGDSKSRKNERCPSPLVGSLGSSCRFKRLLSCLGCSRCKLFQLCVPIAQQPGQAVVQGRLSLNVCLRLPVNLRRNTSLSLLPTLLYPSISILSAISVSSSLYLLHHLRFPADENNSKRGSVEAQQIISCIFLIDMRNRLFSLLYLLDTGNTLNNSGQRKNLTSKEHLSP
jgi:hypothetical protein